MQCALRCSRMHAHDIGIVRIGKDDNSGILKTQSTYCTDHSEQMPAFQRSTSTYAVELSVWRLADNVETNEHQTECSFVSKPAESGAERSAKSVGVASLSEKVSTYLICQQMRTALLEY